MLKIVTFKSALRARNLAAAGLLLLSLCASGCSQSQADVSRPKKNTPPKVGVITIQPRPTMRTTQLPGRTTAVLTSEVRPQVSGVILKRLFTEGSEVREGQALYQIDPATYRATYASAEAKEARARAALGTAKAKAIRYKSLMAVHAISRQDYDDVVAAAKEAQADIGSAQAAVDQARIDLQYTRVLAPISGRIGRSTVTPGALVTANQASALATVTQLDPIYVDVNQSSATMLRLKHEMETGEIERVDKNSVKVTLKLEDGSSYPVSGKLQFAEVTVDQSTGTVLLRAVFPNPDHMLLPGMFVHAVIQEGVDRHGITVPQKAVSRNAQGEATVMVVGKDNTVAVRTIRTGQALGDQWLVTGGLAAGDRVLVDGLQSVRPGAVVTPVAPQGAPTAAAHAASKKS